MHKFYLINDQNVRDYLLMPQVLDAIEDVYRCKGLGQTTNLPVLTHVWQQDQRDMDIKAGCINGDRPVHGLKTLTYSAENDKLGLPRLQGLLMLLDSQTGSLLALLDCRSITGFRTGAASAIGSRWLARRNSQCLLLVGSGNQAFFSLAAHLCAIPGLQQVLVYDPMGKALAQTFANAAKTRLQEQIFQQQPLPVFSIASTDNLQLAVAAADIIVTATPSRRPLLYRDWLKPGTHLSCIGADMEGKQEIDETIYLDAVAAADDIQQSLRLGEAETAAKKGLLKAENCREIGKIIAGLCPGRETDRQITVFDTSGLAIQDLACAQLLIATAEKAGLPKLSL